MKDRLQKLITSEGLTPAILADEIGVQRSGISHILSGRNNPGYDFLQKVLIRFPKLNAEWLLLGKGPMYKASEKHEPSLQEIFSTETVPEKSSQILTEATPTLSEPAIISSGEGDENKERIARDILSTSKDFKKIEKIVTFYTDRTFKEYLPEV